MVDYRPRIQTIHAVSKDGPRKPNQRLYPPPTIPSELKTDSLFEQDPIYEIDVNKLDQSVAQESQWPLYAILRRVIILSSVRYTINQNDTERNPAINHNSNQVMIPDIIMQLTLDRISNSISLVFCSNASESKWDTRWRNTTLVFESKYPSITHGYRSETEN